MEFNFTPKPTKLKTALVAILIGILVGSILIFISGNSPFEIYQILFNGAFGDVYKISSTIRWMTPLLFTAVAFAVAFRGGMFNIGVDGQMYMGAFAGALVGLYFTGLSPLIHIPLVLIVSAIAGMLWALIPALMRVYFGASEIVVTLMLNYVAYLLTDYLVNYYFLAKGVSGNSLVTEEISESAKLPSIFNQIDYGIVIAILITVFFYFLIKKSKLGYEISMSGLNSNFANYGGINVNKIRIKVMLISGAIGGVGGSVEVMGNLYRFVSRFSPEFGFEGMLASLLGGNTPVGVFLGAFFMGALKAGSLAVERYSDLSRALAVVIQTIIICFISVKYFGFKSLKIFKNPPKKRKKPKNTKNMEVDKDGSI